MAERTLNDLKVSDGTGEAIIANIESDRAISAITLDVDSVDNWSDNVILATGDKVLASNGSYYIEPSSMTIMYGHLDSGDIVIDGFAPGYSDVGNTSGQIAIIKPNTYAHDQLIALLETIMPNEGGLKLAQGGMINGKISRTVSTDNITVAIKTLDDTDPSAANPVYVRIGDNVRAITGALSVTKNAGTNWFNSGATSTAAKEIDYFVYLGYNATDGVTIGFARIPFAKTYTDFSATTTDDKYCAISDISNAASTDVYENIGRFNATLSATASFNWSVPATEVVLNYPIRESRWLSFTPVWSNFTLGNGVVNYATFKVVDRNLKFKIAITLGTTSSMGSAPYFVSPMTANADYSLGVIQPIGSGGINDVGSAAYGLIAYLSSSLVNIQLRYPGDSGGVTRYQGISSSAPMTWSGANGDGFNCSGEFQTA